MAGIYIESEGIIKIPLIQQGTKIKFNIRVPTKYELDTMPTTRHVHLTSNVLWNPEKVTLSSTNSKVSGDYSTLLNDMAPDSDNTLFNSIEPYVTDIKGSLQANIKVASISLKRKLNEVLQSNKVDDLPARNTFVSEEIKPN